MNVKLIQATQEYKEVMKNLLQFYMYDFSEFVELELEGDGLFKAYPYFEEYWKEESDRFPYIIKKEDKYIGFALVRFIASEERSYFSIAEFFIMKRHRREGIGSAVAKELFQLHKGQWEVYQKENNLPARAFWKKVIETYTGGQFAEHSEKGRCIQNFKS